MKKQFSTLAFMICMIVIFALTGHPVALVLALLIGAASVMATISDAKRSVRPNPNEVTRDFKAGWNAYVVGKPLYTRPLHYHQEEYAAGWIRAKGWSESTDKTPEIL